MLVLSRKKDESIIIDERIVVTIIEIRGSKVRLGIQADKSVPIRRTELQRRIQADSRQTV